MKRKNGGFTLVELIVVIVIIAVLGAVAALSINYLSTARARTAAAGINSMISKCRTNAISRAGTASMEISYNSDSNTIDCKIFETIDSVNTENSSESFDASGVTLTYGTREYSYNGSSKTVEAGSTTPVESADNSSCTLSFNSSTGALTSSKVGGTDITGGKGFVLFFTSNGYPYQVEITRLTGSHRVIDGGVS